MMAEKAKAQKGLNRWKRKVDNRKLRDYLELERQKLNLLRNQFAERAGIGVTTYNNWCNDKTRSPSVPLLHQLSRTYGFNVEYMIGLLDIKAEEHGDN